MTLRTPDMQSILERLDKLERQNAALTEVLDEVADAKMDEIAAKVDGAAAKSDIVKSHIVVAEQFVLRDAKGRIAGCLGVTENGAILSLRDAAGNGARLYVGKEGPGLILNGPIPEQRASLHVWDKGTIMGLSDKEGFSVGLGSLNMVARKALEAHGVAKHQEVLTAIIVMQGDKTIWSAPPPPKRAGLFSRLFR